MRASRPSRLVWLLLGLLAVSSFTRIAVRADDEYEFDLDIEDEADDDDLDDDFEDVDENRAWLLVQKSYGQGDIVQNSNVTFVVSVYNAGQSSAKSVEVKDSVPEGFQLVDGSPSAKFESIAPGATAKLVYTAVATESGVAVLDQVTVKYISDDDDTVVNAFSLPKRVLVLSTLDKVYKSALNVGQYVTLGTVRTPEQWLSVGYVVGGVAAVFVAGYGYKSSTDAVKRWRYQSALKEVEKMAKMQ